MKTLSHRILLGLLCGLFFCAPSHAQKTKAQLNTEITTSFPDNTGGLITPTVLRTVSSDIVNSILPTAPVVSGNFACFNGTTGLLQDCAQSPSSFISSITGDCTASSNGVITCTKTNSVAFSVLATQTTGITNGQLATPSTTVNGQVCTLGSTCTISASAGTITPGTTSIASGTSNGLLYDNAGLLGNLTSANSGVLITSGGGVPSISSTLPSALTIPSPTFSGTVAGAATIPNAVLANSSVTVGSTNVALGATAATVAGLTLTTPTINGAALSGTLSGTPTLSGANFVANSNLAQGAAATLKGNPTASLANETDFTIQGLTARGPPDANNDKIPIFDNAAGTIKYVTPGQVASAASSGVSSLNSLTGALTFSVVKQKFVASGTYTPTTGMVYAVLECMGSGGGGGGANGGASNAVASGGGGAGSYSRTIVSAATVGVSQSVAVGTAGAGGTAGNNSGIGGQDSSVGILCVGKAGSGGAFGNNGAQGGAGGVAGTGDIAAVGERGGNGLGGTSVVVTVAAGNGGSTQWGAGGAGGYPNGIATSAGTAGTGFGAGGGGAASQSNAATAAGGAGAGGIVFITEYVVH